MSDLSIQQRMASAMERAKAGKTDDAVEELRGVLEVTPNNFDAVVWLSVLLRKAGKHDEAIQLAERAVAMRPMEANTYANLGLSQLAVHDLAGATKSLARACQINPSIPQTFHHLGLARQMQGDDVSAIDAFRRAIKLAPRSLDTMYSLGQSLMNEMDTAGAIDCARQILELKPNSATGRLLLANALIAENRIEEAEEHLRFTAESDSQEGTAHAMLGMRLQGLGRMDEANASFRRSIELQPGQGFAYCALIRNHKVTDADSEMIERMEQLTKHASIPLRGMSFLHFGLGKAYEDLKQYEAAMRQFDEANRISYLLKFGNRPFDKEVYRASIDWIIQTFTKEFFAAHRAACSPSDAPIFILGMMRSGTTLVEQILSSHEDVEARGEQPFWMKRGREATASGSVDIPTLKELADEYLRMMQSKAPEAAHFTDKMPDNYLAVGLIHAAFPNAKILHTRRNPIDTCISIYATPNRTSDEWANNRENIVFAYEQYVRLMNHWRAVLPADRFMDVRYEQLIGDRESNTREMLASCGLDWDEACLHPEDNDRAVATPSVWQVRQPVYSTSIERWRRYEPWLGEFLKLRELGA